ncbi:MAG: Ig-like domain-containing protein, partial [Solirubrobacteraceae bacterium]
SAAGGSVSFVEGQSTLSGCGSVAVSGGTASCSTSYPVSGSHQVTATYAGDANYTGSSGDVTEQIDKLSTTTSLTATPSPGAVGQTVTLAAKVSPVPDGGTVAFVDGGQPIAGCGAEAVAADGSASCQASFTSAGSHSLTAAYGGDADYAVSTSTPVSEQVTEAISGGSTGGGGTPGGGSPGGGTPGGGTPGGGSPGVGTPGGGAPQPRPSVVRVSDVAISRGGSVTDRVVCSGSASCRLTETLTTVLVTRDGRVLRVVAAAARIRRVVLLAGTRTLTVPAGTAVIVAIPLRAAARRQLAGLGRLPVLLSVTEVRDGKRVTLVRRRLTIQTGRPTGRHRSLQQ